MTALAAVWMVTTTGYAQQSTANGAPTTPAPKILVAGENPAITLREKEGGPPLTSVNFWRVHWSPVGSGAVCYVTVSGQGSGDLRIALHDNPKVLDYVTKEARRRVHVRRERERVRLPVGPEEGNQAALTVARNVNSGHLHIAYLYEYLL